MARKDYKSLYDLVEVVNDNLAVQLVVHIFFIFYYVVLLVQLMQKFFSSISESIQRV